jgi:tetratricopeptide (TPR) repeat protein
MKIKMLPTICEAVACSLFFLLPVLLPSAVEAQLLEEFTNPQVSVIRQHPPDLGIRVSKVAFVPAMGDCADEVVSPVIADLSSNGIEVVDASGLQSILASHNISLNGFVDQQGASRLEKVLGPSALVFIRVHTCRTEKQRSNEAKRYYDRIAGKDTTGTVYYAKIRANLKVSVQTIELASGKIFGAQTFAYNPERSNNSYTGYPDFPGDFDVQNDAFRMLVRDVHDMFLPWTDTTLLTFYNDKSCGLKAAYEALKKNDIDLALERSQQALMSCNKTPDVKDKVVAHVNYNLGICYMLREDYDHALFYLEESARHKEGDIVKKAIASCREAKQFKEQMQHVEDKAILDAANEQQQEKKIRQENEVKALTNAHIIGMTRQKVPESLILQKIKISDCRFNTSPDSLIFLTKSGVSEKVISEMMNK